MDNYSECINTFIFRKSWGEIFRTLPSEKAGRLIKAICAYTNGEEIELKEEPLDGILRTITREINQSAYKYLLRSGYFDDPEDE